MYTHLDSTIVRHMEMALKGGLTAGGVGSLLGLLWLGVL